MTLADSQLIERPKVVPETHDDGNGPLFEIVNGKKVEKHMSMAAQQTGNEISFHLQLHLRESESGGIVGTEHFVACFDWMPKTKRRPDVAYWRREQYPDGIPRRGDAALPPAMVVEVVSPNDAADDLAAKVAEYFRAGVELVWVVHPLIPLIRAEQPDGHAHTYRGGDTITAAPVLPGFSAKVADLIPEMTEETGEDAA